jgi:hypothetical protein
MKSCSNCFFREGKRSCRIAQLVESEDNGSGFWCSRHQSTEEAPVEGFAGRMSERLQRTGVLLREIEKVAAGWKPKDKKAGVLDVAACIL